MCLIYGFIYYGNGTWLLTDFGSSFMLHNTIFGRFCVAAIMVLIVKKVVSILRHSYFRVTEYVLVGVIVIVCLFSIGN